MMRKSGLVLCVMAVTTIGLSLQAQEPAAPPDQAPGAEGAVPPPDAPAEVPPEELEVIKERYPNGAVRVERHVYQAPSGDFIKHGPWTMWYPDGRKVGGGEFRHGRRHGKWTRWFYAGQGELYAGPLYRDYRGPFFSEATFVEGKLHGPWVVLDGNKQKIAEWPFKQGVQHGPWVWWYPSGQKRREAPYVDGVLHGVVHEWNPEGKLVHSEEYILGRRKYKKTWWYAPGQKQAEGWYLEGKPNVRTHYDWWDGVGNTVVVGKAGPDARHGLWVWWHPNGQKWAEGRYHDGDRVGQWNWWEPGGKVKTKKTFAPADLPAVTPPPNAAPSEATDSPPPGGTPDSPAPGVSEPSAPSGGSAAPAATPNTAPSNTAGTAPAGRPRPMTHPRFCPR